MNRRFTLFLLGTALVLLGTRLTMRLRWALLLPLLALPAVVDHPVVLLALIAAVTLGLISLTTQVVLPASWVPSAEQKV